MPVFYSKKEHKIQTFMYILRDITPGRAVVFCKNAKTSNFLTSMICENTPLRATSITSRSRRSDVIREVQRFDRGVYQILITNVPFPLTDRMDYLIYYDFNILHVPQNPHAVMIDIRTDRDFH